LSGCNVNRYLSWVDHGRHPDTLPKKRECNCARSSYAGMQPNQAARILELFESAKSLQATALSRVVCTAAEHHAALQKLITDAGFRLPGEQEKQLSPAVAREAVSKPEPPSQDGAQPEVR
jgi:hypothetical protein